MAKKRVDVSRLRGVCIVYIVSWYFWRGDCSRQSGDYNRQSGRGFLRQCGKFGFYALIDREPMKMLKDGG